MKSNIKIVHVSDIHMERPTVRETRLKKLIEEEKPDFIFLTGDYLNYSFIREVKAQQYLKALLAEMKAKIAVFAVPGSPQTDLRGEVENLFSGQEIILLRDQIAHIRFQNGSRINILGIDCDHDSVRDIDVYNKLEPHIDGNSLNILLHHSPEIMPDINHDLIHLYLSGHTHGGQIRIPMFGAIYTSCRTGKKYERGLYVKNSCRLYVNSGLGMEGKCVPRMRLFARPEINIWEIGPEN